MTPESRLYLHKCSVCGRQSSHDEHFEDEDYCPFCDGLPYCRMCLENVVEHDHKCSSCGEEWSLLVILAERLAIHIDIHLKNINWSTDRAWPVTA
jgi:hypothetical protein